MDDAPNAAPPRMRAWSPTARHFAIELLIVTSGVLIALSVDSLREWSQYRALVRQARATIRQEVAQNKTDLEKVQAGIAKRRDDLHNAARLADELIATGKTTLTSLNIGYELADITADGWETAARTGAVNHMDFAEVQAYSKLYNLQSIYLEQQRSGISRSATALAILSGGPHDARPRDLERFRDLMQTMLGDLIIIEQLGAGLIKGYGEVLARP